MNHPLDKPIWSALATRQAHFARGGDHARAFRTDVSPFAAACDDSPASLAALAALVPDDADISLLEVAPPAATLGIEATQFAGVLGIEKHQATKCRVPTEEKAPPKPALNTTDAGAPAAR